MRQPVDGQHVGWPVGQMAPTFTQKRVSLLRLEELFSSWVLIQYTASRHVRSRGGRAAWRAWLRRRAGAAREDRRPCLMLPRSADTPPSPSYRPPPRRPPPVSYTHPTLPP